MAKSGLLQSAHDLSEGGLAVGLAECCMASKGLLGAHIRPRTGLRADEYLFGEDQSRIVITVGRNQAARAEAFIREQAIPYDVLGRVNEGQLVVEGMLELDVAELCTAYHSEIAFATEV